MRGAISRTIRLENCSNRERFDQSLRCFADPRRRQDYFRLYSDDVVLHGYQGVEPGLESVKRFYNSFWEVFPDAKVTVQELIEETDTLVVRYVISGTQQKPFLGVAEAGQRIELPGISILHFRDGKCFERWACSDSLLLLNQLRGSVTDTP
jgi:predicted ester cyclase